MKYISFNSMEQNSGGAVSFKFDSSSVINSNINDKDLLKLVPYGIQISADGSRPILLLKDEKNIHNMPVNLNPLEAGVTLTQANQATAPTTVHKVTELLLQSLNIAIDSCVFTEIRGQQQFVKLKFKNHPKQDAMLVRADEAMSLCLHLKAPMYATADYMARSRVLASELEGITKALAMNPQVLKSQQKYIQ